MATKSFIKTIGEKGLLADYNTEGKKLQTELPRIKDLETSITSFRTGDNIVVDGPQGTAKMLAEKIYYSGNVETLGITALSSITKVGTYAVPLSYMPNITDLPEFSTSTSAFLQVEKTNDASTFIQKITFADRAGVSFWRVISNGVAQPWQIVSTQVFNINTYKNNISSYTLSQAIAEVPAHSRRLGLIITFRKAVKDERVYIYTAADIADINWNNTANWQEILFTSRLENDVQAMGVTALSTITSVGFYKVPLSYLSSITDLPSGHPNVSASLFVEKANDITIIQTLTFTDLQKFCRIVNDGTARSWYKNFSDSVGGRTRFIAMGDSITEGYWADDGGKLKPPTSLNWPYYVGIINNWSVTNAGAGGSGYVHNGTVAPKTKNAVGMVNDVDFSNYDIVSFAWGVNDWHYECNIGDISSSTLNDGTMVGNMRYCVEKVLTDNPKCKIVVILPFNSSMFGGDFDSNWGLGTSLPKSGTLQNVIDKIKSVCEYYGLQMIDSVNNSVVNRFNIEDLFPDGLHPAEDGYLQIARCYAKQMMFG